MFLLAAVALPGATSATNTPPPHVAAPEHPRPADQGLLFVDAPAVAPDPAAPRTFDAAPRLLGLPGLTALLGRTPLTTLPSPFRAADDRPGSFFAQSQIISFYGLPGYPAMGILGAFEPDEAARRVSEVAAAYDALNGPRGATAALHLIVGVAHKRPGKNGLYHTQISEAVVQQYVEAARRQGVLLFLDLQIGWSDPLTEARRLEAALSEPFVHLALDPEFATLGKRAAPGLVIGSLDADQVNVVQRYLGELVREYDLPPKILILHQFQRGMLTETEDYTQFPEVEIAIDMDGFGGRYAKLTKYEAYSLSDYAERAGIKLFYDWDIPVITPGELLALSRPPDFVIYQ